MDNKVVLNARKNLSILGITKVILANESTLNLEMENCAMIVQGENMEVKKLDVQNGNLEVEGIINLIKYIGKKEKTGIFKRIFK